MQLGRDRDKGVIKAHDEARGGTGQVADELGVAIVEDVAAVEAEVGLVRLLSRCIDCKERRLTRAQRRERCRTRLLVRGAPCSGRQWRWRGQRRLQRWPVKQSNQIQEPHLFDSFHGPFAESIRPQRFLRFESQRHRHVVLCGRISTPDAMRLSKCSLRGDFSVQGR